MKVISSKNAPAALGPYSQAILAGKTLYVSGVLGLDPKTGKLAGKTAADQTERIFKSMDAIFKAAGFKKTNVVKCNVFLTNLDDFAACNEVYAKYFGKHKPARACVQISKLVKGALVEIDATACK